LIISNSKKFILNNNFIRFPFINYNAFAADCYDFKHIAIIIYIIAIENINVIGRIAVISITIIKSIIELVSVNLSFKLNSVNYFTVALFSPFVGNKPSVMQEFFFSFPFSSYECLSKVYFYILL
jgi:hypothetical protein